MQNEVNDLFRRYEMQTNAALADDLDIESLRDLYADVFMGAAPAGLMTGRNDSEFGTALASAFARNREIGTKCMNVENVVVEPIDMLHALARVQWRARYDVDGSQTSVTFTNVYLTRVEDGRAKVFGWITGDEDAALREHGIIK